MTNICLCALLLVLISASSESTHFRGGTASWKLLSSNGNVHEVEFNFRFGWRRDYFSDICDSDTIVNQTPGYDGGSWQLNSPAQSTNLPHSVETICTTFEPLENWAYGYNSFIANVTSSSEFTIEFIGNAWIGGMAFGSNTGWSISLIDIDLGVRSDTGKANNPPIALSAPVVRLELGCKSNIALVVQIKDNDGDRVTCRYANTVAECGGICENGQLKNFKLIEETCTLEYDGGGGAYLVPIALMIEDHPPHDISVGGNTKTTSESLSSIPLQFLIDLQPTTSCNVKPSFPPNTTQDNTTIPVNEGGTFNDTLQVYPSRPGIAVIYFVVIGPLGLKTSGVIHYGGDLYGVIIAWIPMSDQVGDFTVCYYAVDADGKSSDQICFTITILDTHPCDDDSNGGCSDTCVPTNSTYTCSCDRTCWNLFDDGRTCIPEAHVTCDGHSLDVNIPICVSGKTVVAGTISNPNPECQSVESSSGHHLNFDNDQCGTTTEASAAGVHYKTKIYIYDGVDTGIVTRGEWLEIPMTCTLPASSDLIGSFVPEIPISGDFLGESVEIEGMGTFTFYFDFYRDSSFSSIYSPSDYPIEVTTQDDMYFILGAVGSGDLEFFTEECVATSNRNPTPTTLSYAFIENGCKIDPTVQDYSPASQMENRFSIQAFQFADKLLATPDNAEVFITCSVLICVTNSSTRCSQGCVSSVSRRSSSRIQDPIARFRKSIVEKVTDDDDGIPQIERMESPLENVSNSFSLLLEDNNGGNDGDNDGGNDATHPVIELWLMLLTFAINMFTY